MWALGATGRTLAFALSELGAMDGSKQRWDTTRRTMWIEHELQPGTCTPLNSIPGYSHQILTPLSPTSEPSPLWACAGPRG